MYMRRKKRLNLFKWLVKDQISKLLSITDSMKFFQYPAESRWRLVGNTGLFVVITHVYITFRKIKFNVKNGKISTKTNHILLVLTWFKFFSDLGLEILQGWCSISF